MKIRRSAFREVTSFDALHFAWKHVLGNSSVRSRRSHGVDFQSITDFDRNPTQNCHVLARELRNHTFHFSPLAASLIPKDNGRYRVICVPTVRDRIVQRSISDYLAHGDRCQLDTNVSFGFLKNKSVEQAAKQAKRLRNQFRWTYKTDITRFFDEIPRDKLAATIRRSVRDRSLHAILVKASECEIYETRETRRIEIKRNGIIDGQGVRQGMPLSPFFANLILRRFDRAIAAAQVKMVRYADDLVCFANAESECKQVHAQLAAALKVEGFSIPEPGPNSKTRIFAPDEPAEFLGVSLRPNNGMYVLEVGGSQIRKIRQRLHDVADISQLLEFDIRLSGFFRRIDGIIAGLEGAYSYCDNFAHFQTVLENARSNAISKLFESMGINIAALDGDKRRFLGIEE